MTASLSTEAAAPEIVSLVKSRASASHRHVVALDGARGAAVLLVMLHHAGAPMFGFGLVGVDFFFVLSGFLITTLLIEEHSRTGTISLPKFWARRFLRLMPAYWLYVGGATLLILSDPRWTAGSDWSVSKFIASMWLYFNNYSPPSGVTYWQRITGHLWSLCVEEQFYFVWPLLCLVAIRARHAQAVAWSLVLAVFVRRQLVHSVPELMYRIDTRGFAILVGCAVALGCQGANRWILTWLRRDRVSIAIVTVFGLTLAISAVCYDRIPNQFFDVYAKWVIPVLAVEFAALTALLWHGPRPAISRALSVRPLVYTGMISYGMYLYHPAAHYLTWKVWLANIENWPKVPKYGLRLTMFLGLSFLFASVSYHIVERSFLRLKSHLR